MHSLFRKAVKHVLKFEGGYVHHKDDLGGATNHGITQAVYEAYRVNEGLKRRNVRDIEEHEVLEIYFQEYWLPSQAGFMTPPLGFVHFDTAVMSGIRGSTQFLQEALGLEPDGDWGPQTEREFKANNNIQTAIKYCDCRVAYRHTRVAENPSQSVFLQGWLNRDNAIKDIIKRGY